MRGDELEGKRGESGGAKERQERLGGEWRETWAVKDDGTDRCIARARDGCLPSAHRDSWQGLPIGA